MPGKHCCCFSGKESEENESIVSSEINSPITYDSIDTADKKSSKPNNNQASKSKKDWSKSLEFATIGIAELDRIFTDIQNALNPFVTNREELENAVKSFKTAVESLQAVSPRANFQEYVLVLKTKLREQGMFIKIKDGVVRLYEEGKRAAKAFKDAEAAIKQILTTGEALLHMLQTVANDSERCLSDFENLDVTEILSRKVSVFDCFTGAKVYANGKKLKEAPKMLRDFCTQVKMILSEIKNAFCEDDRQRDGDEGDEDKDESAEEKQKDNNGEKETSSKDDKKVKTENAKDTSGENKGKGEATNQRKKKDEEDEKKGKAKKKEDYHKKLKIETIGIDDIDRLFTDLASAINRFVITREKLQQAKESFVKIMKTIGEFDGQKEVKAYIKELKEKAEQGKITIYIDISDGYVKVTSIKGVDPPTPYRDAVKALNNMKGAGDETLSLEPTVQRAIEACIRDIAAIKPERDLKKMVSGVKALVTLPKKIKKFNDNRKNVQQAPKIVQEFCVYVKQLVCDIIDAFREDKKDECDSKDAKDDSKDDEDDSKDDENVDGDNKAGASGHEKNTKTVTADVHIPGNHENHAAESQNVVVC